MPSMLSFSTVRSSSVVFIRGDLVFNVTDSTTVNLRRMLLGTHSTLHSLLPESAGKREMLHSSFTNQRRSAAERAHSLFALQTVKASGPGCSASGLLKTIDRACYRVCENPGPSSPAQDGRLIGIILDLDAHERYPI